MSSRTRKFNKDKFNATRWQDIPAGVVREAAREQAEKTTALADAIDHLATMDPDFILPWLGAACPPGWELVAELEGRVMLGTTVAAQNVGTTGGSMSHVHDMGHGHTAPATGSSGGHDHGAATGNAGSHDHTGTTGSDGAHSHSLTETSDLMQNAADGSVFYDVGTSTGSVGNHSHTISSQADHAHSITAATGHTHTVTVDNMAGNTASADSTPAHVKVLFCRRVL